MSRNSEPKPDTAAHEVYSVVPTVQAFVQPSLLQQLEQLTFVRYVRLPDYALSSTGSVDSQGDAALHATYARSTFGVDGTGVRVGVISSGIAGIFATGCAMCGPTPSVPSPISLEDLPTAMGMRITTATAVSPAGTLISVSGGIAAAQSFRSDLDLEATVEGADGAEGTAMLEIVHDLAPGATLSFANADTTLSLKRRLAHLQKSMMLWSTISLSWRHRLMGQVRSQRIPPMFSTITRI